MAQQYFDLRGIETYSNPLLSDGKMIHGVNVVSFPFGAKSKRTGYSTFLNNPDSAQVNTLFDFQNIGNNGTAFNLYRASGTILYHSLQGTGNWTISGNGTISSGAHFGQAILDNTLIGGDGTLATRHSTNGTSFVDTTLAPVAEHFEQYQNRIYAAGTESTLFYSTTNDATNWNTSGTSDSSSFEVPGAGKLGKIFKTPDTLIAPKNAGAMFKWDGFSLIDMATRYAPSSPYSIDSTEGYNFFVNQLGHYGFGSKPELLSNPIQRQFYNDKNTGIAGTAFPTIPGRVHRYDYFASVGTITDDFTSRTISNAIIKYDYQKNEYLNWSFANKPTSFLSFKDVDQTQQFIFGDATGQVYKMDNSTTDNGVAIPMEMVFVFHYGSPEHEKKWNWWRGIFNPGCEAKAQIACANTFTYQSLRWFDLGDCNDGACEFRFPAESRSRFMFVRIYESSKNSRSVFYGQSIDAEVIIKK